MAAAQKRMTVKGVRKEFNKMVKKSKEQEKPDKKKVFQDVERILTQGNEGIVRAFLLNVKAYLHCVEVDRRWKEVNRLDALRKGGRKDD